MLIPQLTESYFKVLQRKNMTSLRTIGALNVKNCRQAFSTTIPKALRDEDHNAYLVIKNHKGKYKYLGFQVEDIAGRLHITRFPDVIWSGYVFYNGSWYGVNWYDLKSGIIKNNSKIIEPELEYKPDQDAP